jgi:hypothetical protein
MLLATSLHQMGLGAPHAAFSGIDERPLVVADETKDNVEAKDQWTVAASSQESLIEAIATTWNS